MTIKSRFASFHRKKDDFFSNTGCVVFLIIFSSARDREKNDEKIIKQREKVATVG